MPAIRDFAQNYSKTTNIPMVCSAPDIQTNDLLVTLVSCDTVASPMYWVGGIPAYKVFLALSGGTAYTDYTTQFNNDTASDFWFTKAAGTGTANDAFYVGMLEPFNGLSINHTGAGSASTALTWEYWNGSAWTTLTTLANNLTPAAAATNLVHGMWFRPPGDWATTTVNAVASTYWIRGRVTTAGTITTRITCTKGWVGGFNQLFSIVSGTSAGHAILYRTATASETNEYGLNYIQTTGDTKNALVASIRDVDTAIPFAQATTAALSYSETNYNTSQTLYSGSIVAVGQSFAVPAVTAPNGFSYRMSSVKFYLKKVGSPTGNIQVVLNTHSGTFGTSSIATTPILAKSNTIDISTLTTSYQLIEFTFPWWYQYQFNPSTNYHISVEYSGGDASNYLNVACDSSSSTHAGNFSSKTGTTWTANSSLDCCFYVYYFNIIGNTSTAGRFALPTMTTEKNDSLLLYQMANAAASVPSIIEGPVTLVAGKDGTAHADAMSWGFKKTAGTTPNNVYASALGTSWNQCSSVIAVNPPASGASVIPPYCVSDSSVYISPMSGAVYLTDAAPITTANTTVFGITINSKSVGSATGATVTYADTGINSYHAMRNADGVITANVWAGNTQVIASRNLSNRNILFHIQPYLPVDIQTTDSVSLNGCCGVAIGWASTNATALKVWHVGGANTPLGVQRHQPAIIHSSYAIPAASDGGLLQSTGTLNAAAVTNIGFFVSGKVVQPDWLMGSVWALDITVVAGGNSVEPLDIKGIVSAAAEGHERKSVTQQGSSQFMIYQPLQIGDGGTNPVYLKLESTALEFPRQYNKAAKTVNYCSVDNVCGVTYYAGASDTIIHKDSVVSSLSKYHWGFHASSSGSANYDLTGLAVIGAGTVTLNANVNLSEVTWNACDQITFPDNTLTSCLFTKSSATSNQGALYITGASQSALQASIDKLIGCSFIDNISPSGALRIEYTGSTSSISLNFGNSNLFSGNTKDILWMAPASSPLTLNLSSGTNPSTYSVTNSNTVTFINSNTFTITNVPASSEVRVFKTSDSTELCGVEDIGFSTPSNCSVDSDPDNVGKYKLTYTHSNTSLSIYVVVINLNFQAYNQSYTLTNSTQSLLVSLISDRQYINPT